MAHETLQISQAQSRIFARAIYKDISNYIEAHQKEYLEFLKEEKENVSKNQSPH